MRISLTLHYLDNFLYKSPERGNILFLCSIITKLNISLCRIKSPLFYDLYSQSLKHFDIINYILHTKIYKIIYEALKILFKINNVYGKEDEIELIITMDITIKRTHNDSKKKKNCVEYHTLIYTDFQSFSTSYFPNRLTVIAWRSVFVLRSISALGTPRKVFLSLFRVTTPKDGLVLTIFVSHSPHSRFVQLHFFHIISLQRNKLWTTRCVDRMLHFRGTFNVHKYRFVPSFSSPSVRWKFFIHRDDNDDQRFHLNDFETPISKETVSDDLETLSSSNYNKSDDCFECLGNDWQVIIKSGWKIIFNWIFSIANEWGYFFF